MAKKKTSEKLTKIIDELESIQTEIEELEKEI